MKKEALGGLIFLAILLYVLMQLTGPNTRFGIGWKYFISGQVPGSSSVQTSSLPPATGTSILGSPSLSAQQVDTILANAGSPAAGTGAVFVADSIQFGIDDAYPLAFFHHESGFGTSGAATQTLSIGNIVCTSGYSCIGRFRAYPSWAAGITDWYALIKDQYVGRWGATTVESIIPHYAPSSDNNDESGYIASVERDVQNWRQQ